MSHFIRFTNLFLESIVNISNALSIQKYLRIIALSITLLLGHRCVMANNNNSTDSTSVIKSAIISSYSTSNELKLISETNGFGKNHFGYAYIEIGATPFSDSVSKWAYLQLIWEQKFWNTPLYLHTEVRSYFSDNIASSHQLFAGLAYSLPLKNGAIIFEPLYRYNNFDGHGAQLSILGSYEWKHFNLNHFTDIYNGHKMIYPLTIYNECRAFYKISKRFEIGLIGIASYSFQRNTESLSASVAIKVNL